MYFLIVTKLYTSICSRAAPKVWWFEEGKCKKISFMIFSQAAIVGVAKISVRGNIQQKCTVEDLKKILKFIKKISIKI